MSVAISWANKMQLAKCDIMVGFPISSHNCSLTLETQEDKETSAAAAEESDDQVWCVCRKEEYGRMILCENSNCKIGWFHFGCVGLSRKPPGMWYCAECRP